MLKSMYVANEDNDWLYMQGMTRLTFASRVQFVIVKSLTARVLTMITWGSWQLFDDEAVNRRHEVGNGLALKLSNVVLPEDRH